MVETVSTDEIKLFSVPDSTNLHRTLGLHHPYGRKKRAGPIYTRAITEAEDGLADEKVVEMGWARPDESVKRIEQAGKWYGPLKEKYAKLA